MGRVEGAVLARDHVEAVVAFPHEHHRISGSIQHQARTFVAVVALGDVERLSELPGDLGLKADLRKAQKKGEGRDMNRAFGTNHEVKMGEIPQMGEVPEGKDHVFLHTWR